MTKEEKIERIKREYELSEHRRCHQCEKEHSIDDIFAMNGLVIQGFTGRVFCYPHCWEGYLQQEGLA